MKSLYGIAFAFAIGATASAQQVQQPPRSGDERAALEHQLAEKIVRPRMAMEVRVTKDAPYSGEAITEFQQVLGDGNRINRRTVTKVFRDRDGRTRRETAINEGGRESVSVAIVDPVAGTSWILNPDTRTAVKSRNAVIAARVGPAVAGNLEAKSEAVEVRRRQELGNARVELAETSREMSGTLKAAAERAASGEGATTREDLGTKTIEGVLAQGTKTTTVIPAGALGNEQPITIMSEQWFSPDLQILVMTRHSDPRTGETTYRLANVVRADPDRSLFEVPADYTVKSVQEHLVVATPRDK